MMLTTPEDDRLANETECEIVGHVPQIRFELLAGQPFVSVCLTCGVRLLVTIHGQMVNQELLKAMNRWNRTVVYVPK